jgi:hypothetical protein
MKRSHTHTKYLTRKNSLIDLYGDQVRHAAGNMIDLYGDQVRHLYGNPVRLACRMELMKYLYDNQVRQSCSVELASDRGMPRTSTVAYV